MPFLFRVIKDSPPYSTQCLFIMYSESISETNDGMQVQTIVLFNMAMENPEKISLQFELLNTFYSKIACKMSHTPDFTEVIKSFFSL